MIRIVGIALALFGATALAQEASLDAVEQAAIGSTISVTWAGPGKRYSPVYIVEAGAPDEAKALSSVSLMPGKNPLNLRLPERPGQFEIRYQHDKVIVARRAIAVVDVPTSLELPDSAPIGSKVDVAWSGPGNQYDFVALVPEGSDDAQKPLATVAILSRRNPVSLQLVETPGRYEVRYVTTKTKRVLARRALVVEDVPAALTAEDVVKTGARVDVTWEGPGNQYDAVALFAAGAPDDASALATTGITSKRNPVAVRVPDEPGRYELRYLLRQSKRVLARRAIQVGAVDAEIEAPSIAVAMTRLPIAWQGPGNNYDWIGLFNPGDEGIDKPLARAAILSGRNPVIMKLPDVDGTYELRYVTAQSKSTLATRAIIVQPAGQLRVVFERESEITAAAGIGAVELILDASGSMLKREEGARRIDTAKSVLDELVRERLEPGRPFALRVFGHREVDSCRTDLEIPLSPLDREAVAARIGSITAMNLAKTPIADSLAKVRTDLASASGPKTVILITDGEETCEGDPQQVIQDLRGSGIDMQLSIVGFAIDDVELKSTFESWADLGGGSYFDARSAEDLSRSLRTVISGPYRVLDASGQVAGEGIIGGAPIVLPAGVYRIEMTGDAERYVADIEVKPSEETTVAL